MVEIPFSSRKVTRFWAFSKILNEPKQTFHSSQKQKPQKQADMENYLQTKIKQ